jgi:hypothetical protein
MTESPSQDPGLCGGTESLSREPVEAWDSRGGTESPSRPGIPWRDGEPVEAWDSRGGTESPSRPGIPWWDGEPVEAWDSRGGTESPSRPETLRPAVGFPWYE